MISLKKIFVYVLIIIGVYFLFKRCLLIVLSYLTAMLLKPLINKINAFIKNKYLKKIVTVIVFVLIYLISILIVCFSIYYFIDILAFIPDYLENIYVEINNHQYLISLSKSFYQQIQAFIQEILTNFIGFIINIFKNIISFIICLFLHFIFSLLFIFDDNLDKRLSNYQEYCFFKEVVIKTILALFKTYFIIFIVTLICLFIGFIIVGIDKAFIIAFLISIFDFFPILGIEMIIIPWIILLALLNNTTLALKLFIIYVVTTIIRNILEPHLLSKQVKLPIIYTFILTYIMTKIIGMLGLIITPFILFIYQMIKNR